MHLLKMLLRCINAVGCIHIMQAILSVRGSRGLCVGWYREVGVFELIGCSLSPSLAFPAFFNNNIYNNSVLFHV